MARSKNIARRNMLVIPGTLLLLYSLAGLVYYYGIREDGGECDLASKIMMGEVCYNAWKLLVPFLVLGIALLMTGMIAYPPIRATSGVDKLHAGTWIHVWLWLLGSLFVVPLVAGVVALTYHEDAVTVMDGVEYSTGRLFELVAIVGLLIFVPFAALFIRYNRLIPELEAGEKKE